MATISDFIPTLGYKLPLRQLLPSQSRSNEPLTAPQIRTLWLHALALFRPFELRTEDSIMAHKHLLKHLIGNKILSSPEQTITLSATNPRVTIADLLSRAHAPCVLFLYLNCGLIRAWLGEYRNAALYFHTAIHMDDRSSPSNTAALHYLLGCAYFMLEEWKHSRKSFERCLLCFPKGWGTNRAELELAMAAPWVTTLNTHESEARSVEKSERTSESKFRYRVFIPCPDKRTTPKSENQKGKEWHEWDLERTSVETNLRAAKTNSRKRRDRRHKHGDEQFEIIGPPGSILFWPVEISNPTAPDAKPSSFQAPRSTKQPTTPCPLPHKPPVWNEETQSFEPYLPPPPTTATRLPTPTPLPSSTPIPPIPKPTWVHLESDFPSPPHTHAGTSQHFKRDIIAPSDHDYSPPLMTQESSLLDYYMHPHSANFALERHQLSKKLAKKEQNRGAAEGRGEVRRGSEPSRNRLKGLVSRSVASLRRGSRRNIVQESDKAEVRQLLNSADGVVAGGESAIEEEEDVDDEIKVRGGSRAKARKVLGLGVEFATERLAVERYDQRVRELAEEGGGPRTRKGVVSRAKVRRVLGLGEEGVVAGELPARRRAEDEDEELREMLEEEMEMEARERELGVSRAKVRRVLGLSYGYNGHALSPRSEIEEEDDEEEEGVMGEWEEEEQEEVEDWVESREEETGVKEEVEDELAGLGNGGTLLPRAYRP
ncbi:MAG: hypothetical protein Q9195_009432 [Heterodermia aff. obscurata]